MKKRNSLLELTRLLAALWVMYYHGFSLITRSSYFSNGYLAVDYFFILTGFFFLDSYSKYKKKEDSFFKGLFKFLWSRFKGLAITFGICFVFSFIYYIQTFKGLFADYIWGYLWYVPFFLLVLAIYYILRSIIKNTKAFNIITVVLITITLSITLSEISTSGILRGIAGIGIGILISQIPKLNFKTSNIVSFIVFSILLSTLVVVSIFFVDARYEAPLCILILFPSIIYFANNANFSNIIINKVCMLSFGLYAYQTVVRWLEYNAIVTDSRIMFLIVVGLAILDLLIKAIVKHIVINKKTDRTQKTTVLPL